MSMLGKGYRATKAKGYFSQTRLLMFVCCCVRKSVPKSHSDTVFIILYVRVVLTAEVVLGTGIGERFFSDYFLFKKAQ